MREPARDKGRLEHILDAIEHIQQYVLGVTFEQLQSSPLIKHATAYNIQIMGEAAYWLTNEFKQAHPATPWRMIEKTRHVLVHDYYQINDAVLWSIITDDIPPLKEQIIGYLKEFQ